MSTKELLKAEIDSLPENVLEKVREFIVFQKFLDGAYENDTFVSRRLNKQHRLVYQVTEEEKAIKVLRMWTHYE